jgi:hypothetical protein
MQNQDPWQDSEKRTCLESNGTYEFTPDQRVHSLLI